MYCIGYLYELFYTGDGRIHKLMERDHNLRLPFCSGEVACQAHKERLNSKLKRPEPYLFETPKPSLLV